MSSSTVGAVLIDGRAAAERVKARISRAVSEAVGEGTQPPGLATVLIGDDPASAVYVASKRRACGEVGMRSFHHELPGTADRDEVFATLDKLNADPQVTGVLVQLPLPAHLSEVEVTNRINPEKDVDGLTIANAGRLSLGMAGLQSCTPAGVMTLLDETGVELRGAYAVVVGRSNLFGKPMAQLLLAADATVTTCHRHTRGLSDITRQADVLIVAVGRPEMVRAEWVKPGAVVIDVGINRTESGLVGDVAFDEVAGVAGAITPVPGGVGPMTIVSLLANTARAAGIPV